MRAPAREHVRAEKEGALPARIYVYVSYWLTITFNVIQELLLLLNLLRKAFCCL